MDWQENDHHRKRTRHRHQGQGFSYFGGSTEEETEEGEIPKKDKIESFYPLAQVTPGKRVWLVGFKGKGGINRLLGMGLTPGAQLELVSSQPSGSVLVAVQNSRIGVGAEIAQRILVSDQPLKDREMEAKTNTCLREMTQGSQGRIIGYDKAKRGYKGKLLSMGLTPGTKFTVIRVAPLGDPVEILVRGFHLSLRKQEADALVVEIADLEEE